MKYIDYYTFVMALIQSYSNSVAAVTLSYSNLCLAMMNDEEIFTLPMLMNMHGNFQNRISNVVLVAKYFTLFSFFVAL